MEQRVLIFDTTLRDGEQTPGVSFHLHEKVEIARTLEELGVDIIEAGFAAASRGDFQAIDAISQAVKNSTVCALARCIPGDVEAAAAALRCAARGRIHVFIATSPIHMAHKLHMSPQEVLDAAARSVAQARRLCDDVEFSLEDATRSDRDFLCRVVEAALDAGATTINLPDTVGYAAVSEYGALIREVMTRVPGADRAVFSVHCHNDLGLAVANSLEGVRAGARQIECTLNGLGERAGNAALEEVVMNLRTRRDLYGACDTGIRTQHIHRASRMIVGLGLGERAGNAALEEVVMNLRTRRDLYGACDTGIRTQHIHRASRMIVGLSGIEPAPNKPIVGSNAFQHQSGIHQHGVLSDRATYEVMKPEELGIPQASLSLGKLSGSHALADRARQLGYELSGDALQAAFLRFKELADRKKEITDQDIMALLREQRLHRDAGYRLFAFQIFSGNKMTSTATVTLENNGETRTRATCGDGPVEACFNAVDAITGMPCTLESYNLKAVTQGQDALGEVTVRVRPCGDGPVEACFNAVDAITGMPCTLESYNLKAVTQGQDALGEVTVRVRHGEDTMLGRGVSTDILEASCLSYLNAVNRLMAHQQEQRQSGT